jgi:hypothetical protein
MSNSTNLLIALGGGGAMFGWLVYALVRLKLAHASLRRLLAEKFHERRCPVPIALVHKTKRGSISLYEAYHDTADSGLVLLIGRIAMGNVIHTTPAGVVTGGVSVPWAFGVFKPRGGPDFLERARKQRHVVLATMIDDGALVVWDDRPSRTSVLRHLDQMR